MNILFIGNSYTFGLPEILEKLASIHGKTFSYSATTTGGRTLKQHSESQETLAIIQADDWDYVVLQEQSQIPSFTEEQRHIQMYPFALKLHQEISKTPAKTLFYQTWGHKQGDYRNIPNDSFIHMQQRLHQGYQHAAELCATNVIPVGDAWAAVHAQNNQFNLYQNDGSHPNIRGVYLNACVFFRYLFSTPVDSGFQATDESLTDSEMRFLEGVVNSLEW